MAGAARGYVQLLMLLVSATLRALVAGSVLGVTGGITWAIARFAIARQFREAMASSLWLAGGLVAVLVLLRLNARARSRCRPKHAAVVVLGDIGRSPRMVNHAVSLAEAGFRVSLIGYVDSAPPQHVVQDARISIRGIPPPWKIPRSPKIAYVLLAPLAAVSRAATLFLCILAGGPKGLVLVQNPPSIPTLAVARILTWFVDGAALVIDWHNYGYTIMATTKAPRLLISLAAAYERALGPLADAHLCVSAAMQADLRVAWGIDAHVVYDRAPARFYRRSADERRELIRRLAADPGVCVCVCVCVVYVCACV